MSDLKKIKEDFLIKLKSKINLSELNQIKLDLFGKEGIITSYFKKIGSIENSERKIKKYVPLSKRQDKPDSALWLIKQHSILKDTQIAKLVGVTKNSVTAIRNKSYWNFNNLNAKDPVAMGLFSQKELIEAIEKAERRIKREKKEKERAQNEK